MTTGLPPFPRDGALEHPERWKALAPPAAYGNLDRLATVTAAHDVLDVLPASEDEVREEGFAARARVIAERLWLLGYFVGGRDHARRLFETDRPAFVEIVARFQRDAALTVDGWSGPETWRALERLVKFEDEPLPPRWLEAESWPPALLRAAQLRLATLGLGAGRPKPDFDGPSPLAVRRFHRVLRALRLVEDDRGARLDARTLVLLLNQDALLGAVGGLAVAGARGREGLRFRFFRSSAWNRGEHREQMRRFMVQLVKVELWLLGLDISIHGRDDYPVRGFGVLRPRRRPERYRLGAVLVEFHRRLLGLGRRQARRRSESITPELFRELAAAGAVPEEGPATEAYEFVASRVHTQAEVDAALEDGRSLGMRIWDGMKRLWRWFRRFAARVVEVGSNLARVFYRYAAKGFQILRRAIRAITESVSVWGRGGLAFGDGRVRVHRDMDLELFVPARAVDPRLGARIALFGHRFLFACRVLRLVLTSVLAGALRRWARLARVLASQLGALVPLYREIQRAEEALV